MVDLQENLDTIHRLDAEVIGVSTSRNVPTMAERFELTFPMLRDADGGVCQLYEAYDESATRVQPATFIIDKTGRIHAKYREQLSNSAPVIEDLRALEGDAL